MVSGQRDGFLGCSAGSGVCACAKARESTRFTILAEFAKALLRSLVVRSSHLRRSYYILTLFQCCWSAQFPVDQRPAH